MYISYFEFRKLLIELEKEYKDLQKNPRVQTDEKFAFYALKTLRRVDRKAKELILKKYKK